MVRSVAEIEKAPARLRPAGPDNAAPTKAAPKVRETLLTCVLVLYPALATVGAIAASLMFSGTSI